MPYFLSPKILFGKGILKRFGSEIQGKGTKATIITDKVMGKFADRLVEAVKAAGYEVNIWDGAEPEPSVGVAEAGGKALLAFCPQLVIGFGGGSAIDTAKAAWILYERPDLSGTELDKTAGFRATLNLRKKARFVAVPTTSGTGSDVTWAIVLTDTTKHRKIGFANNEIVPDIALLDPEFTVGMPKSLTASTGMDVLGHAFDGYTAQQQKDFSDGPCLQAIKMVFEWLPKACQDGTDLVAREKMQNAATIAGLGFGNSNTSLSHALAHSVGATFKMGHGKTVGIAVAYSLEFITSHPVVPNTPDPVKKLATIARLLEIEAKSDQEAVKKLIAKVRELQKTIGEPLSLKEAGITEQQMKESIDTLVNLGTTDVNMYSCPCQCKPEDLKQLFQEMWQGK
jgi:alcohol dehydrogenase class IV